MIKDTTNQKVVFIIDDLTEFYALRELVDELKNNKIPTDIIVPFDSGYNGLAEHTFQKVKDLGYSPLKDAPKNKVYKILFSPYPTLEVIKRIKYIYQIRMPYSIISAKPNPVYNTEFKIDYDAILCFNNYEPSFLNCYGAVCYSIPYWKNYSFPKNHRNSKKPTLLILPTFGQDTSCVQLLTQQAINEIKKHFKVMIKAHHAIHFNREGKENFIKLQNLSDEFYDSDTPITELLQKSDLVLSDNSGSIFEAIYSNTPVVTFSKNLNARHFNTIDTLQYTLMKNDILPYTNKPTEILPLLLSVKPYFKKQQAIKKELFPTTNEKPINTTIGIIKEYLQKDETKDYRKVLHDSMLEEWHNDKKKIANLESLNQSSESKINSLQVTINTLQSDIRTLNSTIEAHNTIFNSGAYKLYSKIISPYKKIRMKNKS